MQVRPDDGQLVEVVVDDVGAESCDVVVAEPDGGQRSAEVGEGGLDLDGEAARHRLPGRVGAVLAADEDQLAVGGGDVAVAEGHRVVQLGRVHDGRWHGSSSWWM